LLLNPDDMREAGIRVFEKSVSSQQDNGGRDRDRTCDPYHVKVSRGARIADFPAFLASCWEKRILNESRTYRNLLRTGCGLHSSFGQAGRREPRAVDALVNRAALELRGKALEEAAVLLWTGGLRGEPQAVVSALSRGAPSAAGGGRKRALGTRTMMIAPQVRYDRSSIDFVADQFIGER
jgi:hypothetical protein